MTFSQKNLHLVPPAVQDRALGMLYAYHSKEAQEIYAQQVESIRDYCIEALNAYEKIKKGR